MSTHPPIRVDASVIIPTYNSAAWVGDAIESVLRQTAAPREVIVVDDGSADDTAAVVRRMGPLARYVRQDNAGPAAARNRGASLARGDWLAFLDADDLWLPEKLERQLAAAERDAADAAFCAMIQHGPAGQRLVRYAGGTARCDLLPAMMRTNVLSGGGSTLLVRRRTFTALGGFDGSVGGSEDRDLFIRLVDQYPIAYVREPLVRIRVGPLRYGGDLARQRRNAVEILRRHAHRVAGLPDAARILREARARIHERAGMHYLTTGQTWRAVAELSRSLCIWPLLSNPWKALINLSTGRRRYGPPRRDARSAEGIA